jgi:uncharacterized protein YqjF (DUF2071 family)
MIDAIEQDTAHRPWPLPSAPWIMFQSWRELLLAHWPVPIEALRPLVPSELVLEEFNGSAWVGITPFRLTDLHPRYLPALPGLSEFPEMNLRTYVRVGDKPGVYFFSLDAASRLAVLGARASYRLPYHYAEMRIASRDGWIHYRSRRTGEDAEFVGRYRPTGPVFQASPGTLEHFLIERYALYVVLRSGTILRGDIHHHPWPVQAAEATIERNTVAAAAGITLPDRPPVLHFAQRQDTLIWPPKLVS